MMGGETAWNMYSIDSNKKGKLTPKQPYVALRGPGG
jgi:hypothetical protein